jgi:hypothetical protein
MTVAREGSTVVLALRRRLRIVWKPVGGRELGLPVAEGRHDLVPRWRGPRGLTRRHRTSSPASAGPRRGPGAGRCGMSTGVPRRPRQSGLAGLCRGRWWSRWRGRALPEQPARCRGLPTHLNPAAEVSSRCQGHRCRWQSGVLEVGRQQLGEREAGVTGCPSGSSSDSSNRPCNWEVKRCLRLGFRPTSSGVSWR